MNFFAFAVENARREFPQGATMKYCLNCKANVQPILKSHPTLTLATLTCPRCESTNLKDKR